MGPTRLALLIGGLLMLLASSQTPAGAQSATYMRTEYLPAMRMTYADLLRVVERARTIVRSANQGSEDPPYLDNIRLSDGSTELTVSGTPGEVLEGAPTVSYEATFTLAQSAGAISSVTVRLTDYTRIVSVEGRSAEQVDALAVMLRDDLNKFATPWGGDPLRVLGFVILSILAVVLPMIGALPVPTWAKIVGVILSPVSLLSIWTLPWTRWLAGTQVYFADPSFIIRYAAEISFVGVLLSIIFFAASLVLGVRKKAGDTVQGPPESE